ncbi:hypothetical protein VTO73DRAFT_7608 [Trametes versicolor]
MAPSASPNDLLYALMLHQTYRYYRMYPGDGLALKGLVLIIVLMETFHTVLWIISSYKYLVTNYFNPLDLIKTHWSIKLAIPAITGMFSQIFYAGRVYYIGPQLKYRLLVAAAIFVMLLYLGWDFAATVEVFRAATIFEFAHWTWIVSVAYGLVVLCDLITTLALIFVLRRSRTGVKRTDTVVDTIVLYTINTGLLTTILGSLVFIFAVVSPDNLIYAGLSIPGVKLYSNSVLATLNSRRSLSERMTHDFEACSHDPGCGARPQTSDTVLETWKVRQTPVTWPVTIESTRSLGTHSDSAEAPSSEGADTKTSLVDLQGEKADQRAYAILPEESPVSKDDTVMTGGIVLMDGEGLVTKYEEA